MSFSEIDENTFEFILPLRTVSEANGGRKRTLKFGTKKIQKSEHWSDAYKRHKTQKGSIRWCLNPYKHLLKLPCLITLTRFAPDKLDKFDNLPMSFKWILDATCEVITQDFRPGRADSSEEIDVIYKQEICDTYAIKIRIQNLRQEPLS